MTKDRGNEPVDVSASLALAARDLVNESKRTLREPARQSTRNNLRPARWYRVIAAIAEPTGDELSTGLAVLMRRDGTNRVDTTKTELIYSDAAIDAGEIVLARQTNGVPFVQMQEATATPTPATCPNGLVRGDCYNVSFGTGVSFPIASGETFEGSIGGVLFPALVAPFEIHANAVLVAIVNSNCNICLSGFPGTEICTNGLRKCCIYDVQLPESSGEYPIAANSPFTATVDPDGLAVDVELTAATEISEGDKKKALVGEDCSICLVSVCATDSVLACLNGPPFNGFDGGTQTLETGDGSDVLNVPVIWDVVSGATRLIAEATIVEAGDLSIPPPNPDLLNLPITIMGVEIRPNLGNLFLFHELPIFPDPTTATYRSDNIAIAGAPTPANGDVIRVEVTISDIQPFDPDSPSSIRNVNRKLFVNDVLIQETDNVQQVNICDLEVSFSVLKGNQPPTPVVVLGSMSVDHS